VRNDQFPWEYFVSYAHGRGFGSMQVRSKRPADNWETVAEFRHTAAQGSDMSVDDIVILNFVPLNGPAAGLDALSAAITEYAEAQDVAGDAPWVGDDLRSILAEHNQGATASRPNSSVVRDA
jgi:hypothetical protein